MKAIYTNSKLIIALGATLFSMNNAYAQCTPPSPVTANPSTFCATGGTTNLNAVSVGNMIRWYTVPVGGVALGTSGSGVNFNTTALVTTTFYAESYAIASGTFNYTGGVQSYTVPGGVTTLTVDLRGAKGGTGYNPFSTGGNGGQVTGTISVTPGQVLNIYVGGIGGNGGAGVSGTAGFNGGGAGAFYPSFYAGGGGGGASDIRVSPYGLANRLAVAGGGGGGGLDYFSTNFERGGMGGGLNGEGGYHGNVLLQSGYPGGGGTQFAGGTGGNYPGWCAASAGGLGIGANGGPCNNSGGGGGGGYYGGGGGVWSGGGGGSSYLPGGTHTQGNQTGAGQVIITGVGCVSASRSPVVVTVFPNPSVTITGTNQICLGMSIPLVANGASSYTWNTGSLSPNITVAPVTNTTYSVIGFDGACTGTAAINVTVNPIPVITIAGNNTACAGNPLNLLAGGANSYTWSTGALTATIAPSPTANITYTVFGSNTLTGCSSSAVHSVTVNAIPTVTMTGPNAMCLNQTITLTGFGGTTYSWSTGATTQSIQVSPGGNTTYSVVCYSNLGCPSLPGIKNVTVNPIPNLTVSSTETLICKGFNATLTASGVNTYSWNTGALTPTIVVSPSISTTYTVTGTNTTTGCYTTTALMINVSPCTGIANNNASIENITLYPNPNKGEFIVEFNNGLNKNIEVFDLMGRSVLTRISEEDKITVNITDLANGIYYVKVRSDNQSHVIKMVKQ